MKLKLDENLPYGLSSTLGSLGHDVHTVYEENLTGHDDAEIRDFAQREGRFLLTQDLDFSDTRKFIPGLHHGVLLVRLNSPSRSDLRIIRGRPFGVRFECLLKLLQKGAPFYDQH